MKIIALAMMLFQAAPAPRHLVFVVDKVSQTAEAHNTLGGGSAVATGEHHSAPIVMGEFSKRCPDVVVFTKDQASAEYILNTQPGATTLTDMKGTVVYVSPAKTLGNMGKDVCKFVASH